MAACPSASFICATVVVNVYRGGHSAGFHSLQNEEDILQS